MQDYPEPIEPYRPERTKLIPALQSIEADIRREDEERGTFRMGIPQQSIEQAVRSVLAPGSSFATP